MDFKLDKDKVMDALKGFFKEAESYINDKSKIDNLLKEVEAKLSEKHSLKEVLDNVKLMISLVKDYVTGTYKDVETKTIISVVAAALYLVAPKDLVPDNVPLVGILDDLAVIVLCWELIDEDVVKYKNFLASKQTA